jgi:predicted nucleic acid-binding protein
VDRVFLDANVLFSAAYRTDTSLRKLFSLPKIVLVTSGYALEEAKRNLPSVEQQRELERLCESVEVVSVMPPQGDVPILEEIPASDRPILWGAISVRAMHLLSGDFKAFGRFYGKTIEGVTIMPPAQYLKKALR